MPLPFFSALALRNVFAALALGVALLAQAQGSDTDFIAARDAFLAGDAARLEKIAPRLKGHLLEAYVAYWQLKLRLDEADPDRVRAFLARNGAMPLADRLRGEWLKSLGKRAEWALFAAEYPKRAGDDVELSCYAVHWKRSRDGDAALAEARPLWFSGQEQPEACQPLFAAMLAQGALSSSDVWARFRLAHEAGNFRLAARLIGELPAAERPDARELERVDRGAAATLAKGDFRFASRAGRELALYALDRVARNDAGSAHEAWSRIRSRMPEPDRVYGNLIVAFNAAKSLSPFANQWYREADGAAQN